jgi:hypothetical protein
LKPLGEAVRDVVDDLRPSEPWVNAEITVVVPLDLPPTATDAQKRAATVDLHCALIDALPEQFEDFVSSARWEDVADLDEAA